VHSYFIESMTDRVEKEAMNYINKIDNLGGMTEAINSGFVQTEIQKAAYKYELEIEANERIIVGVNKYKVDEPQPKDLLKIDMNVQKEQVAFLGSIKAERNNEAVNKTLSELKSAAEGDENLIPFILNSVKTYASVGEICNTLRDVFGEYKEQVII